MTVEHDPLPSSRLTSQCGKSTPLVGRAAQLAALLDAATSPPRVVRLEGEAGVGKTRLLAELRTRAGGQVLSGVCQSFRAGFPLAPLLDALLPAPWGERPGPLLGALVPLLPELADRLPPPLPSLGDPRLDRHRLYRAIREALSLSGPAVLVVDDLHWADDQTVEFLRYLIGHLPERLALVLSYRPREADRDVLADAARNGALTVRLEPLDDVQTGALVQAMLGRGLPPADVCQALVRRTGGVPFAIEEVVRAAAERPSSEGSPWAALTEQQAPEGFREAIEQRLSRVDTGIRAVVAAAAVLAAPANEDELASVAGLDHGSAALSAAVGLDLLREVAPGRYRCRHELAEQAVRQGLPSNVLASLHRGSADVLQSGPVPLPHARIAAHLRACGDEAGWCEHSERAADRATALGDTATAVTVLREILLVPDLAEQSRERLALKLGRTALDGLDHGATVAVLADMLSTVPLPAAVRGELRSDLGLLLINQAGEPDAGYRELERAADELRDPRPDLAARVMSALANLHAGHQHVGTHLRWLAEARLLSPALTEPAARTAFAVNELTTLMTCGKPEAWRLLPILLDEPVDAGIGRAQMRGCLNIVDATAWLGHYRQAERHLGHGRALAAKFAAPYTEEQLAVAHLLLDWLRGNWSGLRGRAAELVTKHASLQRIAAECRLIEGALAAEAGDDEHALRVLREVGAPGVSAPPLAATANAIVAELQYRRGAMSAAVGTVTAALDTIRRTGMWVWATELTPVAVELLCLTGRVEEARGVLREHRDGIEGLDCPASVAALELGEALGRHRQGRPREALERYRHAERLFDALPRPFWLGRTRALLGECALTAGEDGTVSLREAAAAFTSLGASGRAQRCYRILREHGVTERKRGRPGYGEQLSPRELEAATLAASGRTNRQIASALGVSVRTVEQHVAHALRKLNLHSRHDLGPALGSRLAHQT
ncbi:ATP-binding protein [Kibdelosporangium phytohabitans]|uniref:ATP-binding protein n=1 Tax=Kibdelosporangium phytohabitans TaxID=860235 RepID=UPI00146FDF50|nr:LuxR family transcriptional regulator [Kibdelosporangium phytohabitans]